MSVSSLEASILISNALVVPMNKRYNVLRKTSIVIDDNEIVQVGPSDKIDKEVKAEVKINAKGFVALPGLVNTHVHLYQNLLKGLADNLSLIEWNNKILIPLVRVIRKYRLQMDYSLDYYSSILAIIEMIKTGTTTFNCLDGASFAIPQAIADTGIRAVYTPVIADRWIPEDLIPPREEQVKIVEDTIRRCHNSYNGRVKCMIGPTTVFTSTEELLRDAMTIANKYNIGIHMHVNETLFEVEWAKRNLGKSVIEYLDELGILKYKFLAVHCIWCTDKELEILKDRRVSVSHNPESNMKLSSGIAPIPKMIKKGINVALGTDGAASNDNLDMVEAMRITALLHKVTTLNPSTVIAWDVLEMATVNGAKALGLDKEIGSIEEGKKADIILIDVRKPHLQPIYDPVATIVYSASGSDVDTVIIDGKIIMKKRRLQLINERRVFKEAIRICKRALKEAGFSPLLC